MFDQHHAAPSPLVSTPFVDPIPDLIHPQTFNLLIGASGAGKTNLLFSQLDSFGSRGKDGFLGHHLLRDQPVPQMGFLIAQRTHFNIHSRIQSYPWLSAEDHFPSAIWRPEPENTTKDNLFRAISQLANQTRRKHIDLLVVEGIQNLVNGNLSDHGTVTRFCHDLQEVCEQGRLSVIGTVGTPKMKKGEYYPLLSDRVYGSALWAQEADTLIGIESMYLHLPVEERPSKRKVIIQGGQIHPEVRYMDFEDGILVLAKSPTEEEGGSELFQEMDNKLATFREGSEFHREVFMTWARELNLAVEPSPRTVQRWIASRASDQVAKLRKVGQARSTRYQKPLSQ